MINGNVNTVLAQELFERLYAKAVCGCVDLDDIQKIISDFFNIQTEQLNWIRE